MGYNSYEEYMNNLLGKCNRTEQDKPIQGDITIDSEIEEVQDNEINISEQDISKYEMLYPDIYKIVYPMVCKRCLNVQEDITRDLVESITNEIYEVVEKEEEQEDRKETVNCNFYSSFKNYRNYRNTPRINENNVHKETRQRNYLLNDLIKILVLRELIGSGKRPPRPPIPPRPPMPPRPGDFPPPPPPGRPPIF